MKQDTSGRSRTSLHWLRWCVSGFAVALVMGCGGVGEEGTGIRTESANVGALTLATDEAIAVNGVAYRRQAATVTDALGQPLPDADLRIGMWVEVQGTATVDGNDAQADRIRVRAAARGPIGAIAADGTLTVLGARIKLTTRTVQVIGTDAAALAAGDVVEVHGPFDRTTDVVAATRVERLQGSPAAPIRHELRGRVSRLDDPVGTLWVGARQVVYGPATKTLDAPLRNGQTVRVSSSQPPVEGRPWAIDDLRSDLTLPANLGVLYTEGFVDELTAGPLFQLEDLRVDASGAEGRSSVTANGQQVALIGSLVDGTLRARSVVRVLPDRNVASAPAPR